MATDDFFRARLDAMIDLKHPLAVLSTRLPWAAIEAAVAPKLGRQTLPTKRLRGEDLLGAYDVEFGCSASPRPPAAAHPFDVQPAVVDSTDRGALLQR